MKKSVILGVHLQILVTIVAVILGLICLFGWDLSFYLKIIVAVDLLIMAYNNYKIYHKKNLTIVYILVAMMVLIMTIIGGLK